MNPFTVVVRWGLVVLLAGLTAWAYGWHVRQIAQAEQAVYEKWGASNVARNQANDREVERIRVEQQKGIDDANQKIQTALDDARTARDSSEWMRKRYAAAVRAALDRGPATPAAASPAAGDPGILLSDVFAVIDEAAGRLAEYADAARIAGEACERSYDALITH